MGPPLLHYYQGLIIILPLFIFSVVDFVENAVDSELDMDVPQMWEYIAFIIYTAILTDESKEEKEEGAVRPALQDFTPVFVLLANKEDVRKPFGLLTLVLKGMVCFCVRDFYE